MKQLTGLDAAFLMLERHNSTGHVGGGCLLDPTTARAPVDPASITALCTASPRQPVPEVDSIAGSLVDELDVLLALAAKASPNDATPAGSVAIPATARRPTNSTATTSPATKPTAG